MGVVIGIFIGLILLGVVMSIIGADKKIEVLQVAGLTLIVASSIALGSIKGEKVDRKVKQPIKPIVHVECENGKCDTTYIYKFEEKK
jgi:hypothetical protein